MNSEKKANVVTVIFPHDDTHAKAAMSRISGSGYSGAEVDLGNSIRDIALESSDTSEVICDGISFRGTASLYRLSSDNLGFYFVRGGRSFNDGATPRQGFASDTNVGVYVKDKEGRITSLGAEVTFYYPRITDVLINGVSADVLDLGDDWITISVPTGTHDIAFTTVPKSASLDGIKEEITLIAWVKIDVGSRQILFERWFAGGVGERSFELDISDNGNVSFGLSGNGTSQSIWLLSDNTIISDKWTHVAATSDGLIMKMYINGVLDPQMAAPPTSIHTSAASLHIGRWEFETYDWYYPLNGTMDEVKIYNRALTAQEIEDDYNLAPVGIHYSPFSQPPEEGLLQVYPNPFNSSTTIGYKTAVTGRVTINIYNLSGQKIRTLVSESQQADHHSVVWDGTNSRGGSAGSGIYFCTLKIDNKPTATRKLVLLK